VNRLPLMNQIPGMILDSRKCKFSNKLFLGIDKWKELPILKNYVVC